jgi:outer membrane lipoprotein carrier protein
MKKFIVFILLVGSFISANEAEEIIEKIQGVYQKINLIRIDFDRVQTFKLSGIQNTTSGVMFLGKNDLFRMENEEQTVVTDGKNIWTYSTINQQVIIDLVQKNRSTFMPKELLFSYGDRYYANLIDSFEKDGAKWHTVKLTPKNPAERSLKSLKILVKDKQWYIYNIDYVDLNGNLTSFKIKKIDTKQKMPPGLFEFEIPKEAKVMDLRKRHG